MNIEEKIVRLGQARLFPRLFALAGFLAFVWVVTPATGLAQQIVPEIQEPEGEQEAEECVKCHLKVNPAVVTMFHASTMGKRGVQNQRVYDEVKRQRAPKEETEDRKGFLVEKGQISCVLCHGNDHTTITETHGRVADAVCGGCHETIHDEYEKGGGHSFDPPEQSWTRTLDNPEFAGLPLAVLQLSRDVRFSQQGATAPPYFDHDAEYERSGLVLRNGCDSCHTRHLFSAAEARKPEACRSCHAGAGDTVYEAYTQSKHGSLFDAEGKDWDWEMPLPEAYARGEYKAPTCAYCHMLVKERYGDIKSTHDMTRKGIWKRGLQPLLVEETQVEQESYQQYLLQIRTESEEKRKEMILVCRNCHSEKFARRYLDAADQVKSASDLLVLQARSIIRELAPQGTLPSLGTLPDAGSRPATTGGKRSSTAPQTELHRTLAAIEHVYLEMGRRHNVRTSQGAFHQSPRDVLWNGYQVVQDDLNRIEEMASRIRSKQKD